MKTVVFLILLCISAYGEDSLTTNVVGDVTTKISERTDKDGTPEFRDEALDRGKTKILQAVSHRNKAGKMIIDSRTYSVDGESLAIESDEDGDGVFERLMVFYPGNNELEIFTRHANGTVTPSSTAEIELAKKAGGNR